MKRVKFLEGNELHAHASASGKYLHFTAYEVKELDDATADQLLLTGRFETTTEPITYAGPELEDATIGKTTEKKAADAGPVQVPEKPKAAKKKK